MSGVKDYSTTPASNTSLNGIYVGPNMDRDNVRPAIQQLMADIKKRADQTVSFLDFLTDAEQADVLAGTNLIDITAKIGTAVSASRAGAIIDATMLKGTVTLTANPFSGIATAPVTLLTGNVTFKRDFNDPTGGMILLPSKFHWHAEQTVIKPTTAITGITSDASPGVGMVGTYIQGGTCSSSGSNTITVTTTNGVLGINEGANIAIIGIYADTDIIHPIDQALTASTPSTFGFTTSVANTINNSSSIYLLIDSEIIQGNVSGSTFTVTQRGALGTTAASHLINANATLMGAHIDRITLVNGTTVTLASNLPRTFTGATFRCGALNTSLTGVMTIDGEYDRATNPGIYTCLASTLSTKFTVDGNIELKRASHGGIILYGARNATIRADSVVSCGKPASSLGASVWLFGNCYRNNVRLRLVTDGNIGVAIDNKSNGASFYGIDRSCLENVVEIDDVSDHICEAQISGSRDNVVRLNFTNCTTTGVIIDTGASQVVTPPTTTNNLVEIGSQKTSLTPSVVAGNSVVIHSRQLTATLNIAAPLACAAGATTNSSTGTLTGLTQGQIGQFLSIPTSGLPTGLTGRVFASAANTYRIEFTNANAGSQNAPAGDYKVLFQGGYY